MVTSVVEPLQTLQQLLYQLGYLAPRPIMVFMRFPGSGVHIIRVGSDHLKQRVFTKRRFDRALLDSSVIGLEVKAWQGLSQRSEERDLWPAVSFGCPIGRTSPTPHSLVLNLFLRPHGRDSISFHRS